MFEDMTGYFFNSDFQIDTIVGGQTKKGIRTGASEIDMEYSDNATNLQVEFSLMYKISDFTVIPVVGTRITVTGTEYQIIRIFKDSRGETFKAVMGSKYG